MNFELASYYHNLFGIMGDTQYRLTHYENIYFPLGHATLAYIAKGLNLPHGHKFPIDDIVKASIGNKNKVPNIFEFFNGNPKLSEKVNPNISYNEGHSGGDVFLTHAILGKVSGIDFGRLSSDEIINHSLTYSRRTSILPVNNEYLAKMKYAYLDMRRGTSSVVFSNPASIPELRSSAGQIIEALQDRSEYSGTKGTFKTSGLTQAVFLFDILKNIMGDSDSTRLHALLKDASRTHLLDRTGLAALAGCDWHSYMAIVCYYRLLNDKPGMKLKGTRVYQDKHPSLNLAVKILSQEIPVDQHFHNFFSCDRGRRRSGCKTRKPCSILQERSRRCSGSSWRKDYHSARKKCRNPEKDQHLFPVRTELSHCHEICGTDPKRAGNPYSI